MKCRRCNKNELLTGDTDGLCSWCRSGAAIKGFVETLMAPVGRRTIKCAEGLRWLKRSMPGGGGMERVLQQAWFEPETGNVVWKDVEEIMEGENDNG